LHILQYLLRANRHTLPCPARLELFWREEWYWDLNSRPSFTRDVRKEETLPETSENITWPEELNKLYTTGVNFFM
jgi:hypothetical protein